MRKTLFVLVVALLTVIGLGGTVSADTINDVGRPQYPGTSIYVHPGDVIYTPKSKSTFFCWSRWDSWN